MPIKKIFIAALAVLTVGVLGYMLNSREASRQRTAILAADNQGKVTTAQISALREYAAGHMGAGISLELTASYQRELEAAQAASQPQSGSQVYAQAESACKAKMANPMVGAKCIADFVAAHSKPGQNPTPPQLPVREDYYYSFGSPNWTPDFAGMALLTGAVGLVWAGWQRFVV